VGCNGSEVTAGMGYSEAHLLDQALALVLIWRIACAEKYAQPLIPRYSCLVESKHASKVETIESNGGSWSKLPSNHRIVREWQIRWFQDQLYFGGPNRRSAHYPRSVSEGPSGLERVGATPDHCEVRTTHGARLWR